MVGPKNGISRDPSISFGDSQLRDRWSENRYYWGIWTEWRNIVGFEEIMRKFSAFLKTVLRMEMENDCRKLLIIFK